MKRVKFFYCVLYSLFTISMLNGCAKIEDVRRVSTVNTQFQKSLIAYYLKFAEQEAAQYDWLDSQHFINKAMRIAYGKEALPEDPKKWRTPYDILPQMSQARENLIILLKNRNILVNYPDVAAKAQFYFDCWVEQQEENWQAADIMFCRDNFYKYFNQLSNITKPSKQSVNCIKDNKKTTGHTIGQNKAIIYSLSFLPGRTEIPNVAGSKIKEISLHNKKSNNHIIINSYSKKQVSEKNNIKLAKIRAENVKKKLKQYGIREQNIEIYAFAEEKPMASEHEKNNIEIIITD